MQVGGLCLCLLLPSGAAAQEPLRLTLEAARQLAVEQSAVLSAREARARADHHRARQIGAWSNPVLSVRTERTGSGGQSLDQWIAEVGQPLDLAGAARARSAAARLRAQGSEAAVRSAEAEVLLEVTTAYARAVLADRRLSLADRTVAAFERAAVIGRARRDAGDLSGLALRRLELEVGRVIAQRATALLTRRSERNRLTALISVPDSTVLSEQVVLVDTVAEPFHAPVPLDSLIMLALRLRPDALEQSAVVGAALLDVRAEERARLPLPILTAGVKAERVGQTRQSGFVAGVAVPLPVFDARGAAVAASVASHDEARATMERLQRSIRREVTLAWEALQAIEAQRAALTPRLGEEARLALSAVDVGFNEGEIGVTEWLDAVRAYYEAQATLLTLGAETTIEQAKLDMAVGRLRRTP